MTNITENLEIFVISRLFLKKKRTVDGPLNSLIQSVLALKTPQMYSQYYFLHALSYTCKIAIGIEQSEYESILSLNHNLRPFYFYIKYCKFEEVCRAPYMFLTLEAKFIMFRFHVGMFLQCHFFRFDPKFFLI